MTRGVQGDIITQIFCLDELPTSIISYDIPSFIEIRGEIFMEHQKFLKLIRKNLLENLSMQTQEILQPVLSNCLILRRQGREN